MKRSRMTPCFPYRRTSGRPSLHAHKRMRRFSALFSMSLLFLLLATVLENMTPMMSVAHAQTAVDTANGVVTLNQFNQLGNVNTTATHSAFVRPSQVPAPPQPPHAATKTTSQPSLPSAEPAKMKSFEYQLDSSFVRNTPKAPVSAKASTIAPQGVTSTPAATATVEPAVSPTATATKPATPVSTATPTPTSTPVATGTPAVVIPGGTAPLDAKGSDGRLEILLPRGAVDLTNATIDGGTAPVGTLSVQVSQKEGHYTAERLFLGTYVIQVVDSQGHIVHGLTLTQPMTIRYHYTTQELQGMSIDPNNVLLSWPDAIATALNATPTTSSLAATTATSASSDSSSTTATGSAAALTTKMVNDAATQTFSTQISTLGLGTLAVSSDTVNQAPPTPEVGSVGGNSGQFGYSYPISIAPGPAGFAPQVQLVYSSQSTNERHSNTSPTGASGEGWSISLGSISMQTYPSGSTSAGTWYFLNGIDGVSDRLVPDTTAGWYQTEHVSRLKILKVNNNCWYIWGKSGDFSALGCDSQANSLEYTTDSSGKQQIYQWNLDHVVAPYNNQSQSKTIVISYLQDTPDNGKTIRDSGIKQIRYGTEANVGDLAFNQPGDLLAGTIDFHYHAPLAQGSWADSYGSNYNCASPPAVVQTLRCDDPTNYTGGSTAPQVMSTMTLDSITSYVGDDSNASHKAYSYSLTYNKDVPFSHCYDHISLVNQYCAGSHTLARITPSVYQNGTAYARQGMTFFYTGALVDGYYDPNHTTSDPKQHYGGQTYWQYLNGLRDLDTGQGETVSYMTAEDNSRATPYVINADGSVDDRHDPLYCTLHAHDSDTSKQCSGDYWSPDQFAWSIQVVTQTQALGRDSSSGSLQVATTKYNYTLQVTGTGCHPLTGSGVPSGQSDCVSDYWSPVNNGTGTPAPDQDWVDYYHEEFRGFNAIYITSPAGNLTANYYYSTEGLSTNEDWTRNALSGQLYQQDIYQGNRAQDSALLQETVNSYTDSSGNNSCNGLLNLTYVPCEPMLLSTRATAYEAKGRSSSAPWSKKDYLYDDYTSGQHQLGAGYHNLLQETDSSSNASTITKKYQYKIDDQVINGWTYYTVDKVSHSEVDDASGHVWACQNNTYDEGRPAGTPAPDAGLVTTTTTASDCSNMAGTALSSYTGYDQYGNAVAAVDPFGAANSSVYGNKGCTLATAPVYLSSSWTTGHYTKCSVYDATHTASLLVQQTNALGQSSSTSYNYTQGAIPSSVTDANGQTSTTSYSYDSNGNITTQVTSPGASSSYSNQAKSNSHCSGSSSLPCYETDTNSALYANAITRTFYDAMGRQVEVRAPLDSTHDLVTYTVHDDANATTFTSTPFRVATGSSWIDPATAKDENGNAPTGTISYTDALGRVRASKDPALGSAAEPGITCQGLSGSWSSCVSYGYGSVGGDAVVYSSIITLDANNHMVASLSDMMGRSIYSLWYSTAGALNSNIVAQKTTQYNALNKATSVTMSDLAPQPGQNLVDVTMTATYDDLGRVTSVNDPDRGTHTYTYDADGRQIADNSGTRTVGTSYDLLGRVGCVQDLAAPSNDTGSCSSGSNPLVQNTYDTGTMGSTGTTDFPVGQMTQSVATTYYPNGGGSAVTTQQYQHDRRGRETNTTLQIALPSGWNATALPLYQESLAYNDANQGTTTQTMIGSQNGYTFSQAYDSTTGTLTGLSNNASGVANLVSQGFDLHGMTNSLAFQSQGGTPATIANESFTYDGNLRPANEAATWQSDGSTIFSNSRSYDPVGNVSSVSTTQAVVNGQSGSGGSETQNFCYDEENRLVWAGNSGTQPNAGNGTCGTLPLSSGVNGASYTTSYTYNHLGKIWQGQLSGKGPQLQYLYCNGTPHAVTGLYPLGTNCSTTQNATASYSASYNAWGDVTSRIIGTTTAQLWYDVLDHFVQWGSLDSSNQKQVNEQYVYDASGQRVLQRDTSFLNNGTPSTNMTVYAFGLEEHTYTGNGTSTGNTYYYSFGGRLIGQWDGNSATQYDLTDAQGSVLAAFSATTGTSSVLGNQLYDPYGNRRAKSGSLNTNKGYTGQYNDSATGLDYYNARYYDPAIARFMAADTVQGNAQGMDPYDYVGGNPESRTDPTGNRFVFSTPGEVANPAGITNLVNSGGTWLYTPPGYQYGGPSVWTAPPSTWQQPHPNYSKPKPKPAAPPPNPWSNVLGGLTNAAKTIGGALVNVGDQVLGVSSMVHDFQTIFGGNASVWEKLLAGGDLLLNSAMDISMLMGVGEFARGLYAVGRFGGEMLIKDLEEQVTKEGEKGLESALGSACSFTFTTSVATSAGEQAIGTLKPGEKVLAYNPKTKKMELEPIVHVWINHDNDLVDLTITSTQPATKGHPAQQVSETIHTNQKHPFLTVEAGFVPVANLSLGMHVVRADGTAGMVTGWKGVPGTSVMYNLEVAQDHTFVVGAGEWVVHNCGETRGQMFNQAKQDAGIPTSSSPTKQGWVNKYSGGEPQRVYEFDVDGAKKYIVEHRFDPNGRGLHFHVADVKYPGQDLFQDGEKYLNLGHNNPNILDHYPESFSGFSE